MTTRCEQCGTLNKETAKFCASCGTPLGVLGKVAPTSSGSSRAASAAQPALAPKEVPPSEVSPASHQGFSLILQAAADALHWPKIAFGATAVAITLLVFGLTAFISSQLSTPQGQNIMFIFGMAVVFVIAMIFSAAVIKYCYESIVRNTLITRGEATSFAFSNFGAVVLGPLVLFIGGTIVGFIEAVMFSSIHIQDFGEVVVAILFTPFLVMNIGLGLILTYGTWLMHVTVAEHQSPMGKTFNYVYRMLRLGGNRIVPNVLGLSLGAMLVSVVIGYSLFLGYGMTFFFASRAAGLLDLPKLSYITGLPQLAMGSFGSLGNFLGSISGAYSLPMQLANIIFWLGSLVAISVAAAYPLVFFFCGIIRTYVQEKVEMASLGGSPVRIVPMPRTAAGMGAKVRCPHCGSMQDADAKFCQACGKVMA